MTIIRTRDLRQADTLAAIKRLEPEYATPGELAMRLVEAAAGIAMAEGFDVQSVYDAVDARYNLPPEKPGTIGNVGVALLAYAASKEISAETAEREQFARLLARLPESIRARMKDARMTVADYEGEAA